MAEEDIFDFSFIHVYYDGDFVGDVKIFGSDTREDIEDEVRELAGRGNWEIDLYDIYDHIMEDPISAYDIGYIVVFKSSNNNLASLPPFPDCLRVLDCSDNKQTSIPPIPDSLREMCCRGNLIPLPPSPPTMRERTNNYLSRRN